MARYIRYQTKQGKTYAQLIDALRKDGEKINLYAEAPAEVEILHSEAKGEVLILDFGDSFMLDRYLRDNTSFFALFSDILPNQRDTLLSLIHFRLLTDKKAYMYAQSWHARNYASILYPKARLQSQRISDFLIDLGSEDTTRDFFASYLGMLYPWGYEEVPCRSSRPY